MYYPTESERNSCIRIVKDLLNPIDDRECEKYVNDIFSIAYSIGGDYGNETLSSIAETMKNHGLF